MLDGPSPDQVGEIEHVRLLEVLTDANLAHLSVEKLLDELLVRVRDLLVVDTAAVLLLDPSGQFLSATAARGIEEEVHQGVRIPLGQGFAGRIAQGKRPVALEQVDHSNVLNPILREKGIHSLLGVPLIAGGAVLGVLHVGSLTRRRFVDRDATLLQLVADRIALAVQTRLGQDERATSGVMYRGLQPTQLPHVDGVEFAARYVPGDNGRVGGDWYDVFNCVSGQVCLVVGDVAGHGVHAALLMGELRSVLRGYTLITEDPAEVLSLLNTYLRRFHPELFTTVMCAMLDPSLRRLSVSSAGHLPPVHARPGRPSVLMAVPPDLPLGVLDQVARRATTVELPPGSVVAFYTDGLVERRTSPLDSGLDLLRGCVDGRPAEAVCATVMATLIGAHIPEDDVALLVLRRHDNAT
jgi:hypothetical protein